jgi:uncharacterized protein YwqG
MMIGNTRKTSIMHVGGFTPTCNPFASHFGLTPLALPNETWPTYRDSDTAEEKPLFFVCQLNLTEAPYVPHLLKDIKLITLFVHPDLLDTERWCIRAYKTFEGLIPLQIPGENTFKQGVEVSWELALDQPVCDDPALIFPDHKNLDEKETEDFFAQLNNLHLSKLGGYSSNIQSEPWWDDQEHPANPKYCLQIDSEDDIGLHWGDLGTFYIARGTSPGFEDQWFVDCQCY